MWPNFPEDRGFQVVGLMVLQFRVLSEPGVDRVDVLAVAQRRVVIYLTLKGSFL